MKKQSQVPDQEPGGRKSIDRFSTNSIKSILALGALFASLVADRLSPQAQTQNIPVGVANSTLTPETPTQTSEPKILTTEEIEENIQILTKLIEFNKKEIEKAESNCSNLRDFRRDHTDKYGTIDQRKLKMKEDYKVPESPPLPEFPFIEPHKNKEYRKAVFELYTTTQILQAYMQQLWIYDDVKAEEMKQWMKPFQEMMKEFPLPEKFIYDDGTSTTREDPQGVYQLILYVAMTEINMLESPLSICDIFERSALERELTILEPDLMTFEFNKVGAMNMLEPVLKKMMDGYPHAFPAVVVHASQYEYLRVFGDDESMQHTGGVHRPFKDRIDSFADQHLYSLILTLAHEFGHPVGHTSEEGALKILRNQEQNISRMKEKKSQQELLIEELEKLRTAEDKEKSPIQENVLRMIRELNNATFRTNLFNLDLDDIFNPNRVAAQLDEAVAYLVQGACVREMCKDDPELLRVLWQLRAYSNTTLSPDHHGAYKFAEEILETNNGDYRKTIESLATENNPAVLERYRNRIKELNEGGGIENTDLMLNPDVLEQFDVRSNASEVCFTISNEGDGQESRPEYHVKLREKIATSAKEALACFRTYLQLTFPNGRQ